MPKVMAALPSEYFLNGTSAHIRLFRLVPYNGENVIKNVKI